MHWYMYVGMLKMYWKHDLENLHVMYIQCNLIFFKLSFPFSNFSYFFSIMNVWKSFRFRTLKWKQTSFHKRKLLVFIYTVHNIKWILKWFKTISLSTRTCTCITWISYYKVFLEILFNFFCNVYNKGLFVFDFENLGCRQMPLLVTIAIYPV